MHFDKVDYKIALRGPVLELKHFIDKRLALWTSVNDHYYVIRNEGGYSLSYALRFIRFKLRARPHPNVT